MIRILQAGLAILISLHVYGQNLREADSLITLSLNKDLKLEKRIRLFINIAYSHPDASVSLNYSQTALDLARKNNNPLLQARAWEEIGSVQRVLGNNPEALKASLKALNIYEQLRRDDLRTAVLVQLGSNAVNDEAFSQAIVFFNDALSTYVKAQDTIYIAVTLINIGEVHRSNQQLDSAVIYFKHALELNHTLKSPIVSSYSLGNLGMAYNSLGQLKEAREALNESLELVNELGDPYTHAVYLADLALIDQKEQNWSEAQNGYLQALGIARENGLKEQIRDISEMLVGYYKLRGDYEQALSYQELFQVYQDSLVNKENVQELERVKSNHEISRKEAEITQLTEQERQRKRQVFVAMGVTTILIGLSLLLYQNIREKRKANLILINQKEVIHKREEEKALLLKELNHRVKNNLQMISSLLNLQGNELKGHPAEAAITAGKFRVDALALIHQKLYREDVHTTIAFKDYIEELVLNLCYSFENKIRPNLNIVDVDLNIDQAIPLALIVNELVTNALKYAYQGIEDPELQVEIIITSECLKLYIRDNGKGMPEKIGVTNSFGLKLVQSLIYQLEAQVTWPKPQQSEWKISIPLISMENTSALT